MPYDDGFVIQIPTNTVRPYQQEGLLMFLGRVPTNTQTHTIIPSNTFNLIGMRSPARLHPSQMNLVESGFKGGAVALQSDRIRKLDRALKSTGQDVWYRTTDQTWRYANNGLASDFYITPDDGFLIWTRASTNTWIWTSPMPFSAPTPLMSP